MRSGWSRSVSSWCRAPSSAGRPRPGCRPGRRRAPGRPPAPAPDPRQVAARSRNRAAQNLSGNWSPASTGTRSCGGPLWNRTRSRTARLVTMPDTTPRWPSPPPPAKVTRSGLIPEDWVPRPPPPPWFISALARRTCCRPGGGGLAAISQTLPWALAQRRTRDVPWHPRTRLVTSRTMPPGSGPGYGPGCALTLSGVTEGIHLGSTVALAGVVVEVGPAVGIGPTVGVGVSGRGWSASRRVPITPPTTARTTSTAVPSIIRSRRRRPRLTSAAADGVCPSPDGRVGRLPQSFT